MYGIERIIGHVLDGNAVLFTGGGFSHGAQNRVAGPIPSGTKLAEVLLAEAGYRGKAAPLDKAAASYLRRKPETALVDLILDQFTPRDISESHRILASLPWRRVYTTNYDTVYEVGRKQANGKVTSLDAIDEPRDHLHKQNVIIHINGSVDRVSASRLGTSFKLTTTSYATDDFMRSPWAFHFRSDLRSAKAIVFIGYSMYDLDIRRILYEEDMSERSLFVIGPIDEANELDAEDLADLGLLAPIGVDSFAEQVRLQAMEHVYRDEELLLSVWTRQEDPQPTSSPPTDAQVRDFLVYGRAMESLLPEAASVEAYRYCLPRQEVVPIFEAIRSSPGITVVHGGLGTGKTFLSYVVGHMLSRAGFLVYRLDTASSDAMSEVEEILRTSGDKVFIIDGYRRHLRMLERIVELTGSDCRLLLLERSSSHEVIADELDDLALKTVEFDLDELTQSELRSANDLLDRHGLWGERQAWGEARKLSYLRNDCESRLPHLLVSVLEAVHVSERYREVVASSPDSRGVRTLLIATSVLTVLNHIPRVSVLQELLGPALILSKYRRYEELKDIIDITSMDVRIRSSVLAQHLLQKVFSAGDIADVLIGLVRQADALKRQERLFAQVHADLMRYSNVAQMLPEKQRLAAITRYYENIKDLPSTRANPQFWLQYAIGCLTNRALDRAATYFADAYSWAAKVDDYDTFQIDNHYARFLLQKALTDQPAVDALQQVLQARDIVLRQVRTEIRKYPFRVACSLFDAYESLSSKMAPDFQKQLRGSLAEIYRRASQTKGNLYRDRYVQECIRRGEPFERVSS